MTADPRSDRPLVVHRLLVAVRFVDVFLGTPVAVPLEVSIDALRWQAFRSEADATYRFQTTNPPPGNPPPLVPPPWDVTVGAPGGEYVNWQPFQVQPVVPAGLPLTRDEYLMTRPLWPTRLVRPSPGETAVVGHVARAAANANVAGLEVALFPQATRQPNTPWTRTDDGGEFLFRLPGLRVSIQAGPPPKVVTSQDLGIEVRDGATLLTAPGQRVTVQLGNVTVLRFIL